MHFFWNDNCLFGKKSPLKIAYRRYLPFYHHLIVHYETNQIFAGIGRIMDTTILRQGYYHLRSRQWKS
jgi:hypothetical protein